MSVRRPASDCNKPARNKKTADCSTVCLPRSGCVQQRNTPLSAFPDHGKLRIPIIVPKVARSVFMPQLYAGGRGDVKFFPHVWPPARTRRGRRAGGVCTLHPLAYNVHSMVKMAKAKDAETVSAGPHEHGTLHDEIAQLDAALSQVVQALRAQRDALRHHGMSLPPGTLSGFRDVQQRLQAAAAQLAKDTRELTQLHALAQTTALITSTLDLHTVLNEVMDTVIALTGAERGYIVLRDEKSGQMQFRVARNLDRETIDESSFIVSRTIVNKVAESGEPVLTTNAQADPNFSGSKSVVLHALRSILCVPLLVRGQVTGVVYVDNRIKNALFSQEHLELLVHFANQAAIAIQNARLFEEVQTALAEITEVKELMENVFASIASGVIATDEKNIVTTYNAAAERILGVPRASVLGVPLADALPIIYRYVRNMLDVIYAHGSQEIVEVETELPQRGQVSLNLKLTPLRNQEAIEGVTIVVEDLTEIKKRDATLNLVRRYLPPAMVDNISRIDELGLGGERREITVLFVETRPFSAFPANTAPQALMDLLNLYLTVGAEAIHQQNGVIDKFMGSEIMALFNTQLNPTDAHAWWAVQAALKMAEDYTRLLQREGKRHATPYYRIGIHSGEATLGNVGSPSRREFTAIGHTVNLAKRLQENATPAQIIISAETYRRCQAQLEDPARRIKVTKLPPIQVKGVSHPVPIYEIRRVPAPPMG